MSTVTETAVPPIAQEREYSIREDTFWRLGFLLAFLGHGVTLGLHQTVPADEGLSTAVRLAMGPRNQHDGYRWYAETDCGCAGLGKRKRGTGREPVERHFFPLSQIPHR